jgi:hypothetical protein
MKLIDSLERDLQTLVPEREKGKKRGEAREAREKRESKESKEREQRERAKRTKRWAGGNVMGSWCRFDQDRGKEKREKG